MILDILLIKIILRSILWILCFILANSPKRKFGNF